MMAMVKRWLGINVADTTKLKAKANQERMLRRLANNERIDSMLAALMQEVRK